MMHLEEPPKLVQPRDHKAKVVLWADLSVNDMDIISEAVTPDQVKDQLSQILHLDQGEDKTDLKCAILLDLYYYSIQFCRDCQFNKEQTSAFFSIVKKTHEVCVETPFGNVQQCFCYFKELLLCHAVRRPPYSIDLFNADQVRKITDYVINTYFRHFKMYKYVFTPLVRLDLSMTYAGMPETPVPSEAGDEAGEEGAKEDKEGEEGEQQEGEQSGGQGEQGETQETATETDTQQEESAAAQELRSLIRGHLSDELKKLKVDIDIQIKESSEVINQKLTAAEGSSSGGKGGKHSAKGKKK